MTITAARRLNVTETRSEVGATARAALDRAKAQGECNLAYTPTPEERAEAERRYPAEHFTDRASIAETLVGGPELLAKYQAGHDTEPAGYALAQAAVDCRRASLSRPVTEAELRHFFPLYLPTVPAGLVPTAARFTIGMEWATEPVASHVALLTRADPADGPPAYTVLDHIVSADDGTDDHPRLVLDRTPQPHHAGGRLPCRYRGLPSGQHPRGHHRVPSRDHI